MKQLLFFILILLISITAFSQVNKYGVPFITNYSPKKYNAHPQNWAITQDNRGVMYFGNGNGVLEYDGINWDLIDVTNKSTVWSLDSDTTGIVYVGAVDEFGCLLPNKKGKLKYHSISSFIDSLDIQISIIRRTFVIKDKVYFLSPTTLFEIQLPVSKYIYNNANEKPIINIWQSKTAFIIGYKANNNLFVREKDHGLKVLKNGELVKSKECALLKENKINPRVLAPLNRDSYFVVSKNGVYHLFDTTILELPSSQNKYIQSTSVYIGCKSSNNNYTIGTLNKGIFTIDQRGNLLSTIDRNSNLGDNQIFWIKYDKQNLLWAGTNNGISKIEINSPIKKIVEEFGIKSVVADIINHNGREYISTSYGIYVLEPNTSENTKFELIENTNFQCWDLIKIEPNLNFPNGILLAGTTFGIYQIENKTATKIEDKDFTDITYSLIQGSDSGLYIGTEKGLLYADFKKNGFNKVKKIPQIKSSIFYLEIDSKGNIWVPTDYNGIYKISQKKSKFLVHYYDTIAGLPQMEQLNVCNTSLGVLICSNSGIYIYEAQSDEFKPFNLFGREFCDGSISVISVKEFDKNKYIINYTNNYSKGDKNEILILRQKNDSTYEKLYKPFARLPQMTVTDIYADSSGIIWIGGTEGLFTYNSNIKVDYGEPFNALIRKTIIGEDSVIFNGTYYDLDKNDKIISASTNQPSELIPTLEYHSNDISFYYTATFFEKNNECKYSYFIEGYSNKWSEWNSKTEKEYTNLSEGEYTFMVKAKNIYDTESSIAKYNFIILPPWYRTIWAYIAYVIIGILLVWIIIKLYTRKLIKEKEHLEEIVKQRTTEIRHKNAELEQQKEEILTQNELLQHQKKEIQTQNEELQVQKEKIENQADELEIKNKELEKLSIVASETENAVIIMDDKGNFEWINASFTRMFGYTLDELKTIRGNNIIGKNTNEKIKSHITKCINDKVSVVYEFPFRTKSENELWVQTTLTPILNETGEISKLVAIDSDITALKEAEQEIAKQRDIAEAQRDQISKQKEEITDSIHYASRIQTALIPPDELFDEVLKEYFILFKPRDIVSGDYYWLRKVGIYTIVVAADCTGHGVPGAFMSMLGIAFLNEIITGIKDIKANLILNQLREKVKTSLRQTGGEGTSKDGMDIALYVIDETSNYLQFAGAYNPLYIIRNGELEQIKADKMPIGIHIKEKETFTNNEYQLEKGDCLYTFSDGYPDQFGGEKGKKFMSKRFKNLLIEISQKTMTEQHQILDNTIEEWKAHKQSDGRQYEQVDDILVIGVRI